MPVAEDSLQESGTVEARRVVIDDGQPSAKATAVRLTKSSMGTTNDYLEVLQMNLGGLVPGEGSPAIYLQDDKWLQAVALAASTSDDPTNTYSGVVFSNNLEPSSAKNITTGVKVAFHGLSIPQIVDLLSLHGLISGQSDEQKTREANIDEMEGKFDRFVTTEILRSLDAHGDHDREKLRKAFYKKYQRVGSIKYLLAAALLERKVA